MPVHHSRTYDAFVNMQPFRKSSKQSLLSVFACAGVTAGILTAATLISLALRRWGFSEANYILTYMLGVLFIAYWTRGYVYGIIASVLSVLVFNFFFTEPFFSFNVNDPEYLVTFAIMLVASIITSTLTTRIRFESWQAETREKRIRVLYQIERHLLASQNLQQVLETASNDIFSLYGSSVIITQDAGHLRKMTRCIEGNDVFNDEKEKIAFHETLQSGNACGAGTELFWECKAHYRPILGQNGVLGVVGIVAETKAEMPEDQRVMLDTILAQVALAIEREQSNERQRQAQMQIERERFRSDLLRSISHDLRTPLTGILGSTSTMIDNLSTLPNETIRTFLQNIYEDADWLKNLVENILSMTRLHEGRVTLKRDMEAVEELIAAALARVKMRLQHHTVTVSMPDEILMVYADGLLIEQAIVNILDNAIKYTPSGGAIAISASVKNEFVWLEISNDGPGIPQKDIGRIFERFYTKADEARRSGIGLGLSICKSIIEAHGGEITAQNITEGGTKFIICLPMKETDNGTVDPDRG